MSSQHRPTLGDYVHPKFTNIGDARRSEAITSKVPGVFLKYGENAEIAETIGNTISDRYENAGIKLSDDDILSQIEIYLGMMSDGIREEHIMKIIESNVQISAKFVLQTIPNINDKFELVDAVTDLRKISHEMRNYMSILEETTKSRGNKRRKRSDSQSRKEKEEKEGKNKDVSETKGGKQVVEQNEMDTADDGTGELVKTTVRAEESEDERIRTTHHDIVEDDHMSKVHDTISADMMWEKARCNLEEAADDSGLFRKLTQKQKDDLMSAFQTKVLNIPKSLTSTEQGELISMLIRHSQIISAVKMKDKLNVSQKKTIISKIVSTYESSVTGIEKDIVTMGFLSDHTPYLRIVMGYPRIATAKR
ncbi:phosphoprotein [alfalfa-associated nucleorhabdovirus]|uniref:Phosphoprotein n=1 Tax=alfalfa-associated nucleorhabdovirus TaxID=2518374 RepID=A0A451G5G6_9RHAB|nr:phosphoprotein [alfalfa-associated nucleorhabdovirus]QAB45071.1 phosphoprotein [alfalfa-associated nucleorhabdovirus]UBX89815.1 phosphoprotein [alfalfa-associated nucleorhabdovirus]